MTGSDAIQKGIILAGGAGTRLFPITKGAGKQLLPIYNKPLIYYPLTTLMTAGIQQFLVITRPDEQAAFSRLLGSGHQWGISIEYATQSRPRGIAEALLIAAPFLNDDPTALILGDNIFYGTGFRAILESAVSVKPGATIFAHRVGHPQKYGVVELDRDRQPVSIEEKPKAPRSDFAVTGLYFYDGNAARFANTLTPSKRGELEITCLNRIYMERGELRVVELGRNFMWLDTGTPHSMLRAANFVEAIEARQGRMVACPEEVAWHKGWINDNELGKLAGDLTPSEYGSYLTSIVK